jgi:hypothetical protein
VTGVPVHAQPASPALGGPRRLRIRTGSIVVDRYRPPRGCHGVVTIHDDLGRSTRGFVGLMGSSFHRLGRVSDGGKVWRCRLGLPLLPRITSAAYHQGTGSRVSPLLRVVRACLPVSSRNRRMRPRVSTAFPSCASERIDGRAWPGPDGSCGCLDRGGRACRRNEGI